MQIDEIDLDILTYLASNPGAPIQEICKEIHNTHNQVFSRTKKLLKLELLQPQAKEKRSHKGRAFELSDQTFIKDIKAEVKRRQMPSEEYKLKDFSSLQLLFLLGDLPRLSQELLQLISQETGTITAAEVAQKLGDKKPKAIARRLHHLQKIGLIESYSLGGKNINYAIASAIAPKMISDLLNKLLPAPVMPITKDTEDVVALINDFLLTKEALEKKRQQVSHLEAELGKIAKKLPLSHQDLGITLERILN